MTATPTPKKGRRKATTELGRNIMQRERQRMAREQAALGEALVKESRAARIHPVISDVEHNAISRGIVRRIAAVLASEKVNVPLFVRKGGMGMPISAWTDFNKISVTYQPLDDKRLVAASLRGAIYHEGGHCRFTPRPADFWKAAPNVTVRPKCIDPARPYVFQAVFQAWNSLEDQRMETAVVSDSPRKAAYLTPLIMTELTPTPTAMAANYPLLVWRRYLPRALRDAARKMFITAHNLMGLDGESLARQCEDIVNRYVLGQDVATMWQAVCDMHDLMQVIRPTTANFGHERQTGYNVSKRDLSDYLIIPIDQDMIDDGPHGDEPEEEPQEEVDQTDPKVAEHLTNTLIAMWNHPETLIPVITAGNCPSEPTPQNGDEPTPEGNPGGGEDGEEPSKEEGENGEGEGEGKGEEEGDKPSKNAGTEAGDHSGAEEKDGAAEEKGDFTKDDLKKMLQDAQDERDAMPELDADMRAFDDARDQASTLPVYVGGMSSDAAAVTKAVALADEIERSFHTHTMDREPAWVEGQRRGMLNVLRYTTRKPGEVEIFRNWTEDDQPGYDISVSLLLDYSGSMNEQVVPLAQCAYAVKLACQNLGIPCTVSLWDTNAVVLWDATERADGMPVIREDGGTDPTVALRDLDNQRMDKAKHLVLIMTDGDWQHWTGRSLAAYKEPGRHIYGFGMGYPYLRQTLIGYGCDDAFAINDLMEIPHRLEQYLLEMS